MFEIILFLVLLIVAMRYGGDGRVVTASSGMVERSWCWWWLWHLLVVTEVVLQKCNGEAVVLVMMVASIIESWC